MERFARLSLLCLLAASSCAAAPPSPYQAPSERGRDPGAAAALAREAGERLESDPVRAKELLERALALDLFCGAAHNNLGVLHLRAGHLYEAAHELEWARKLLPGNPDPRLNLALVLERAGREREAMETLETALEVAPQHRESLAAWAKLAMRASAREERIDREKLERRLSTLALEGESERWRQWARESLRKVRSRTAQEVGR